MKRWWHLYVPVLGLLLQPLPVCFVLAVPNWVYGENAFLTEPASYAFTIAVLTFFALVSLILGNLGVYGLLTRLRLAIAVPMVVVFSAPTILASVIYGYAVLIFLTLL